MSSEKLFCFDVFGVLHDGENLFPKTKNALIKYKKQGNVVILTNSTLPSYCVKEQLAKMGLGYEYYDEIISSGDILIDKMKYEFEQKKTKIKMFSKEEATPLMEELLKYVDFTKKISEADYVYISSSGIDIKESLKKINLYEIIKFAQSRLLSLENLDKNRVEEENLKKEFIFSNEELSQMHKLNKKFICTNPDILATKGDSILTVQGFQAKCLEALGLDIIYLGKPSLEIYLKALKIFNTPPEEAFMFGDQYSTDIRGANEAGIRAILVRSAITDITKNIGYKNLYTNEKSEPVVFMEVNSIEDFLQK